ncbi:DUF1858 domain-containing protein [Patescibacteria group bacterium]|nr:DUF1858 domain-containing protein [Patescibacteria group bacterium]MBU4016655.1 DUF1858 domain-containing protein [Patescibacteria group bacterium]
MASPYILTKSDLLINVMQDSPRAAQLLTEYGLHCLTCFFREFDTLEMGAKVHGMTDDELDNMIKEINSQLKKEWKEQEQKKSKSKITNSK